MRIAFVQMNIRFGDKQANLAHAAELIAAHPADLYVLPELCTTGYLFTTGEQAREMAEPIPGGVTCQALCSLASGNRCYIVAGMAESADGRIFNSAVLCGPTGFVAIYRKIHLFDEEKEWFSPGDRPFMVHDIGQARLGLMICFDWIFPEAMRSLALQGADIVCHPANLVLPYCQKAMVTRCLENGLFAVTANRIGMEERPDKRLHFTGGSQITAPRGEILLHAPRLGEMVGIVDIDPLTGRDKALNARNDLLKDRRPEYYATTTRKK
jgi:predicted amidohydrolase